MTPTMAHPRTFHAASLLCALLALAPAASASPLFSIGEGTGTSWDQAIANGNVRPVTASQGLTEAAVRFYTDSTQASAEFDSFALVDASLAPDLNIQDTAGEEHQSLVMSWNNGSSDTELPIAAWEYVYDQDPDLRKTLIEFSLFAPPGIWDVSLELIDDQGRSRGWFLSMPPSTWQVLQIDPNLLAPQSFQFFFDQPGFDIRRVVAIRLDEAGNAVTLPVPGGLPGTNWNAWNHLRVIDVTEPTSLLLMVAGMFAVGLVGVRRRP